MTVSPRRVWRQRRHRKTTEGTTEQRLRLPQVWNVRCALRSALRQLAFPAPAFAARLVAFLSISCAGGCARQGLTTVGEAGLCGPACSATHRGGYHGSRIHRFLLPGLCRPNSTHIRKVFPDASPCNHPAVARMISVVSYDHPGPVTVFFLAPVQPCVAWT